MAGWKRRITGIAVISAGVCAALPFRNEVIKSPSDVREGVESPDGAAVRHDLTLQLMIPPTPVVVPTSAGGQQPSTSVAEREAKPLPHEVRRDELQAPPSIASTFEPLVATSPIETEESSPQPTLTKPEQRHRIVDGDTLEAIAERYLGSRDLWPSIYAENDELLTDRDILPIDIEIRIPSIPLSTRDEDDDDLVPIPVGILDSDER